MANTLGKLIYDLHLTARDGRIIDDDDLDQRQIKYWVTNQRAIWVRNELSKNRAIPTKFIQNVETNGSNYVNLEWVDASLVPALPIGCKVLRTTVPIPSFIEYNGQPLMTRVGPAVLNYGTFARIPLERLPYIGSGRANKDAIYSFWYDYYVYVVSMSASVGYMGLKKINIQGVFSDPTEVPGYLDTEDYPISEQLIPYLKDMIIKSDVMPFLSSLSDKVNNATDDTQRTAQASS